MDESTAADQGDTFSLPNQRRAACSCSSTQSNSIFTAQTRSFSISVDTA